MQMDESDLPHYREDSDLASVRLLVTDLDRTLLTDDHLVPEGMAETISKLAAAGVVFCPASGRPFPQMRDLFLEHASDIAICSDNGGLVTYRGKTVSCELIDPKIYREVLRLSVEGNSGIPMLCALDRVYVLERDRAFDDLFAYYFPRREYVESYDNVDAAADKISLYYPDRASAAAYDAFSHFSEQLHVTCSGGEWLDFMCRGVNKGEGIARLCDHLGIDLRDVAAAGDTDNDIELLERVGHSFIVENASEGMHRHARFVIPSNSERGVLALADAVVAAKRG